MESVSTIKENVAAELGFWRWCWRRSRYWGSLLYRWGRADSLNASLETTFHFQREIREMNVTPTFTVSFVVVASLGRRMRRS